jgi:hypothetical protein
MVKTAISSGLRGGKESESTIQDTSPSMWALEGAQGVSNAHIQRCILVNNSEQFALTVISYQLSRICQTFPRVVSKDVEDWKENISMTLSNQKGVIVSLFR